MSLQPHPKVHAFTLRELAAGVTKAQILKLFDGIDIDAIALGADELSGTFFIQFATGKDAALGQKVDLTPVSKDGGTQPTRTAPDCTEAQLEYEVKKLEAEALKRDGKLAELGEQLEGLESEMAALSAQRPSKKEMDDTRSLVQSLEELEAEVGRYDGVEEELEEATRSFNKQFEERKRLQNLVHELKGNVRVFCRCRPVLAKEEAKGLVSCVGFPLPGKLSVETERGKKDFQFDEIFPPSTRNGSIFPHVEPLCTSVLDGFNVCIFAYGQTGSGKTFTMEGIPTDVGINYAALGKIFTIMSERSKDFESKLSISLLEIYNETLRDLLDARHGSSQEEKLEIRFDKVAGTTIPGLTLVPCTNLGDVVEAMKRGYANRATSATGMNDTSSRSHCVLTVWVETRNLAKGVTSYGKLQLIDLAGSERLKKTGASGQQLKEAQNINKSLSALGNVISSRVTNEKHTPYRDSKLTLLLQDSLMGDSKVLMFVNMNPLSTHASETICSLQFAERANKVILGKAVKKTDGASGEKKRGPTDEQKETFAAMKESHEAELMQLKEASGEELKKAEEKIKVHTRAQMIDMEISKANVATLRAELKRLKAEKDDAVDRVRVAQTRKTRALRDKSKSEAAEEKFAAAAAAKAAQDSLREKRKQQHAEEKARQQEAEAEKRRLAKEKRQREVEAKEAEERAATEAEAVRRAGREAEAKAAEEAEAAKRAATAAVAAAKAETLAAGTSKEESEEEAGSSGQEDHASRTPERVPMQVRSEDGSSKTSSRAASLVGRPKNAGASRPSKVVGSRPRPGQTTPPKLRLAARSRLEGPASARRAQDGPRDTGKSTGRTTASTSKIRGPTVSRSTSASSSPAKRRVVPRALADHDSGRRAASSSPAARPAPSQRKSRYGEPRMTKAAEMRLERAREARRESARPEQIGGRARPATRPSTTKGSTLSTAARWS